MKSSLMLMVASLTGGLCAAQELGRVISSTPVVQQVTVPRQICSNESIIVPEQKSGGGAALGAIAGGAIGNAVGQGSGRAVATLIGIFGGAMLGDRVEGRGAPQYQNVQNCSTQNLIENRVAYYSVVYEYAGKQYAVQMPNDPGPQLQLRVSPVDALPPVSAPVAPTSYLAPVETRSVVSQQVYVQPIYAQPIYAQPIYTQPIYVQPGYAQPVYRGYYGRPYAPPVGANLQFGYSTGQHDHGHTGVDRTAR